MPLLDLRSQSTRRSPSETVKHLKSFSLDLKFSAGIWDTPRRVVAKVEWHAGELFPRVGFIVTNLRRDEPEVVHFYNQRGTAEQWIKEGKHALNWTRLSCGGFADNQVRLQLFALEYNLGNFLRRGEWLCPSRYIEPCSVRYKCRGRSARKNFTFAPPCTGVSTQKADPQS